MVEKILATVTADFYEVQVVMKDGTIFEERTVRKDYCSAECENRVIEKEESIPDEVYEEIDGLHLFGLMMELYRQKEEEDGH